MAAKDLLVDNGGDREAVKTICEGLPEFDVVPSFTYTVQKERFQ